ncbi:MAG: hypothetical protein KBD16_01555 [Candidatus Pacebacteria bacterium]|nr:hypothetical protein [Candidatus Paceibacterota bacterium]
MKKLLYLVPVLIILFLLAAFFMGQRERGTGALPMEAGVVSVVGHQICLPHKDTTGPQTKECASGFLGDDGIIYGLDLASVTFPVLPSTDSPIRVEGNFTPTEALSSDMWQKYDMVGIISVTEVEIL